MNKIDVTGEFLKDTPIYWQNFIRYAKGKREEWQYNSLIEELAAFNAKITNVSERQTSIVFETDRDKLIFLMRWS